MSAVVKVYRLAMDGLEVKEVSHEEAKRLIEEAGTQGNVVLDKETGNVIDDRATGVREIIVVGVLGGG